MSGRVPRHLLACHDPLRCLGLSGDVCGGSIQPKVIIFHCPYLIHCGAVQPTIVMFSPALSEDHDVSKPISTHPNTLLQIIAISCMPLYMRHVFSN